MEKACPEDAEPDESFQYLVDSIEFELPKVRFSFSVSPPPPPPFNLEVYEELVAMDPHGFQMVRSHLEEIFPRLSDVATSSMGANVGAYIADFEVTPAQITKAFLASHGMTQDGLGARVIEARHTGRWRPACKEMFTLFDDRYKASAGKLSQAHLNGNHHFTDLAFDSPYDRNLMLYAMLEIKLSLDKDSLANVPYSTLGLYDTICGGGVGGYRVPTAPTLPQNFRGPPGTMSIRTRGGGGGTNHPTYQFQQGYEIDNFAPIVMYGSLEAVRSAYMLRNYDCTRKFAPEDVAHHMYCNMADRFGGRRSYLKDDAYQRATYSPLAMHKDRLCNPKEDISIEDTLARPPMFTSSLYDTPYRSRFYIDYWIVPYWHRGEEDIDGRTFAFSMRSFVYITSSSDRSVRPGMHRLLDLPVFGDKLCSELPSVNCAGKQVAYPFILNRNPEFIDNYEKTVTYTRGRLLMRRVRCSQLVSDYLREQTCDQAPYAGETGCSQDNLVLLSRPTFYSSRMWLNSLIAPPPSPPPFSPSPPPPSPFPPSPISPPSPPYVQPQSELMAAIRTYEEQACTSVYYLTTTTRCERLAVALTQSVLYDPTDPPSPPPANPDVIAPPPPSPPPSPSMPEGIVATPIEAVRLSTMRIPTVEARRRLNLYDDGYYVTESELASIKAALVNADHDELVRCTPWQSSAPLPCVSGAMEVNCLSGTRHCGSDAENSDKPAMEITLSGTPGSRKNRLWGFELALPHNEELANLFFHSADTVGGSGYEVVVYKSDGSTVPCQPQNTQVDASGLTSDRKVQHVCAAGGATDADLYALMEASRIRITLTGTYRQIWLRSVSVMELSIEAAALPPRPPRPPPLPALPPAPPQQPSSSCTFNVHQFHSDKTVVFKEPCGLSSQACCDLAHEYGDGVDAFELDDAGCCLLVRSNASPLVGNTERWGFLSARAGTGSVA
jgi:hypothetical protein